MPRVRPPMPAPTMSTLGLFELSFSWGMLSRVGIVVMEWNEDEEIGTEIANTIQQKTSGANLKYLCLTHFGRRSYGGFITRLESYLINPSDNPFEKGHHGCIFYRALLFFLWFH